MPLCSRNIGYVGQELPSPSRNLLTKPKGEGDGRSMVTNKMSFLAGRLAASEGAFFSETSKHALSRLKGKLGPPSQPPSSTSTSPESLADVLPEILQHSPPLTAPSSPLPSHCPAPPSSLAASLSSVASPAPLKVLSAQSILEATNGPLAFFGHVPHTTFGPKRWKPELDDVKLLASTANEARMESSPIFDEARGRAVMEGYFSVFKAFAAATTLMVGGATVLALFVGSRLQIYSIDDIRTKGHEYMQPQAEAIRQQFEPWKHWAEQKGKAWRMDENQYKTYGTNFGEFLGAKQSLGQPKEKQGENS